MTSHLPLLPTLPKATVTWWKGKTMAVFEMCRQIHTQGKSHLADVTTVEKLVRCVHRANVLLPATNSPGLIPAARDSTDQFFLLVCLQVVGEDVLGLESLPTDGALMRFAIGVSVGYVSQESGRTVAGHIAVGALLRVDVATNVLSQEALIGERLVTEGTRE